MDYKQLISDLLDDLLDKNFIRTKTEIYKQEVVFVGDYAVSVEWINNDRFLRYHTFTNKTLLDLYIDVLIEYDRLTKIKEN
jgi:nucleoside-specific outer membrane channel protein Tsx